MVQITRILWLANIRSNSGGAACKAVHTPKGLYKFLIRQCDRLPNVEIQKYYKHHIRQGFGQHADESDPERVTQIINQATKDIDWILKKLLRMALFPTNSTSGDTSIMESACSSIVLESACSSPLKFFHALSTFTSRPELVIPHIRSTDIDWASVDSELKKCYNVYNSTNIFECMYSSVYHENIVVPSLNVSELNGSLNEETIKAWMLPSNEFRIIELVRNIHHKPFKDAKLGWTSNVHERWDFQNLSLQVYPIKNRPEPLAYVPFISFKAEYSVTKKVTRITVTRYDGPLETDVGDSLDFFKTTVVPKIFEWMSDGYSVDAPKLTRLRARPHSYISNQHYWFFYDLIKSGPAEKVKSIWKESTDPVKFIHEDIGIASYIASFIYGESSLYRPNNKTDYVHILDLGCGNGLLCFFLSQILPGYTKRTCVSGFDIRRRNIWDDLIKYQGLHEHTKELIKSSKSGGISELHIKSQCDKSEDGNFSLTERTFIPDQIEDLVQRYSNLNKEALWLIGNHSDELTPWIPVVARKLNATGFFIIPCCPFDFFKKYQRRSDVPGTSNYMNYIEYICKIGDNYGYQPTLEKLRIPSTKNICLIGMDCKDKFETNLLSTRVEEIMHKLKNGGDEGSRSLFVPRAKESAKENPKLDRTIAGSIVDKIFELLIKDWDNTSAASWYAGRVDVTFSEITLALTEKEREMLKGKGRGLRTLIKSNRHLFVIEGNTVKIRIPNERDIANVSESSRDRIKTRDCYFKLHHPQGCPLATELCSYKH